MFQIDRAGDYDTDGIEYVWYRIDMSSEVKGRSRPTREQTRARIMAAAESALIERGIEATSLDDIAASAGLTKGAIYSSFPSKDALFAELVSDKFGERLRKVSATIDASAKRGDLARRVGKTLTEASLGDPGWQIAFFELSARSMRNPELRGLFAAHRSAALTALADFVGQEAARRSIKLPLTPMRLATTMLALSNGLALEGLLRPEAADSKLLGDVLELLFRTPNDSPHA